MYLTMNLPVTARGHPKPEKMTRKNRTLKCPKCGSTNIFAHTGFITGFKYNCEDCEYVGALVIEEDEENIDKDGW